MVQYLSGGAWGLVARRMLEASTRNLPLMAVLFIPIWLKRHALSVGASRGGDRRVIHKGDYLNAAFFTFRAALFFPDLGRAALILNKWSPEQDEQAAAAARPAGSRSAWFRDRASCSSS